MLLIKELIYFRFIKNTFQHYEEGHQEQDKNWMNSSFECVHRVKFDLFRRFGLIAAAGD